MKNYLLFIFAFSLPAQAGPDLLSPIQKLGELGNGPMCDDFSKDQYRERSKKEREFLFSQQEAHRHFPETQKMMGKDTAYLLELQEARADICYQLPEAASSVEMSKGRLGEVNDNGCKSYSNAILYLRGWHEALVKVDKRIWNELNRLVELDSNLHSEHKVLIQGLIPKAGALGTPLAEEMRQVYFHSTGTVSRPILQAIFWESDRIDQEGYQMELKIAKLEVREQNCVGEPDSSRDSSKLMRVRQRDNDSMLNSEPIAPVHTSKKSGMIDIMNPTGSDKNGAGKAKPTGLMSPRPQEALPHPAKMIPLSYPKHVFGRGISADDNYFQDPQVKEKKNRVQVYKYVKHR